MDKIKSMVDKVSDKLDRQGNNPSSDNYGPHSSNVGNKMDPAVDSDLDGRNNPSSRVGGYGNTQTSDTYGQTTGPGGLGSSDTYGSSTNNPSYDNPQSTNAGPHGSNVLNKMDPRVDSDRDGRNDPSSRIGGYGQTQTANDGFDQSSGPGGIASTDTQNTTGTGGYRGTSGTYDDPSSTNTGPHSSNLMNKLDPRVDSDLDGRNDPGSRVGGYGNTQDMNTPGYGSGTGSYGTSTTGAGYDSTAGTTGGYNTGNASFDNPQSTNAGPHGSNVLNKLDPRVDSDRDGRNDPTSRVGGYGNTQDTTGSGYSSNTPGYDASTTGAGLGGSTGGGFSGSGNQYDNPQSTNAGPHSSNLLNKLDPRVDSDRDGRNDPTSRVGGYGNTQDDNYGGGPRY